MKSLALLLAGATLLLVGCHREPGHTDATIPPALSSLAPEPVAVLPPDPKPAPVMAAEPDPEPTPQEVAAFNAKVPK